jgi:hypothetical protein
MLVQATILTLLVMLCAHLSGARKTTWACGGFLGYLFLFTVLNPY